MSATLTGPPQALFEARAAPSAVAAAPAAPAAPPAPAAPAGCAAPSRRGPAGGRPTTLEERLARTWRALHEAAEADCPICHTAMRMESGSGHCTSCGTTLS
jgi:hypothetical protein